MCPNGGWNMFLPSASSNSLISIALRTYIHANVSSQTIACANPEPNKKLKFGARNPDHNLNIIVADCPKGREVGGFRIKDRVSRFDSMPNSACHN